MVPSRNTPFVPNILVWYMRTRWLDLFNTLPSNSRLFFKTKMPLDNQNQPKHPPNPTSLLGVSAPSKQWDHVHGNDTWALQWMRVSLQWMRVSTAKDLVLCIWTRHQELHLFYLRMGIWAILWRIFQLDEGLHQGNQDTTKGLQGIGCCASGGDDNACDYVERDEDRFRLLQAPRGWISIDSTFWGGY